MKFLSPFALHKIITHCDGCTIISVDCWLKIIFLHKLAHVLPYLIKKNLRPHFSYIMSYSWLGIIINSQRYEEKLFVNDLLNTIQSIFSYCTGSIYAHVIECIIIIKYHFDYIGSLFINRRNIYIWGIYNQYGNTAGRF